MLLAMYKVLLSGWTGFHIPTGRHYILVLFQSELTPISRGPGAIALKTLVLSEMYHRRTLIHETSKGDTASGHM